MSSLTIHDIRVKWEEPVYKELNQKYGTFFQNFWKETTIPHYSTTSNIVLLVERRKHPNIEFVIQNAMYYCKGRGFGLAIVTSDVALEYVKDILGKHLENTFLLPYFKGIGDYEQGRDEYNKAFLNTEFWEQIPGEWILSIQTDSYIRKEIPDIFWEYEYIACPWAWKMKLVGGGGITWRKKSLLFKLLTLETLPKTVGEDVYFSQACEELEVKVPDESIRHELLVESTVTISKNPFGVHQWWTYLVPEEDSPGKEACLQMLFTLEIPSVFNATHPPADSNSTSATASVELKPPRNTL